MRDKRGFTFIELAMVLLLLGVMLSIALTMFNGASRRKNLDVAVRAFMADMLYVQQKNMSGVSNYQITLDKGNARYYIQAGINTERTVVLSQYVQIAGTSFGTIHFNPDGTLIGHITDGNDYVQLQLSSDSSQNRFLIVQLMTGRIRVSNAAP